MSSNICINDIPQQCVAKIATYLGYDDLLSFAMSCKHTSSTIKRDEEYVQKVRTLETFTANPYKKYCINNEWDKDENQQCTNILDMLEDIKDLCEQENVQIKEINTPDNNATEVYYKLWHGDDRYYITNLHIKCDFNDDKDYIFVNNGPGFLRIDKQFLMMLEKDSNGYYHLYNDYMLLVPKLFNQFTHFSSKSSYISVAINSSRTVSLRFVMHKVKILKANTWINRIALKNDVSVPIIERGFNTSMMERFDEISFHFMGKPVAICINIRNASSGLCIDPSLIRKFTMVYKRRNKELCKVSINARSTHCALVQKYENAKQWSFAFKDCFIIPFNTKYCVKGKLQVKVHLKSPIDIKTTGFYLYSRKL